MRVQHLNASRGRWGLVVLVLAGALWMALGSRASTTWVVNSTADTGGLCQPGGQCTLRAAIHSAASGDTILVPKGYYKLVKDQLVIKKSLTISGAGPGLVTIHAPSACSCQARVFQIAAERTVTISGVTVTGGGVDGDGGGIAVAGTLVLRNSRVTDNRAFSLGGGIYNDGTLIVSDSTISANNADNGGGGIYNDNGGALAIAGTTLSHNATSSDGGGLYDLSPQVTRITNTTIAANDSAGQGGGIFDDNGGGGLYGTNLTVASNSAPDGANVYFNDLSAGGLQNTIVAYPQGGGGNCDATVDQPPSLGHNLEDDGSKKAGSSCGFGFSSSQTGFDRALHDHIGIDPRLGRLAFNGGPTRTMALLSGSPAIGHAAKVRDLTTDQRGAPRPWPAGGAPDIGAYESGALVDMSLTGTAARRVTVGHRLTITLTATNGGPSPDAARQVRIVDVLPGAGRFISRASSPACAQNAGSHSVTCRLGRIGRGRARTVKIVTVPQRAQSAVDTASVSSAAADPDHTNDRRTFPIAVRDRPAVQTKAADPVAYRGATLHGSLNPNNATTRYYFQYGRTSSFGSRTASQVVAAGTSFRAVRSSLRGLRPGTLYHYRLVAENAVGVEKGRDRTLFTPYLPALHVSPPRARPGTRVHVYGSAGECPVGKTVTILSKAFSYRHHYEGKGAIYATVRRGGRFSTHTRIPASRKGGPYKVSALCGRFPAR